MTYLHSYFEMAVHDAAHEIWPYLSVSSWTGLVPQIIEYNDRDSDVGNWLKLFFDLSYLEPGVVMGCFAFDILQVAPEDEKVWSSQIMF